MSQRLTSIYSFIFLIGVCSNPLAYDYPLTDPYEASIIGTPVEFKAKILDKVNVKTKKLKVCNYSDPHSQIRQTVRIMRG